MPGRARPVRTPDGGRLAPLRRSVRALLSGQPGPPAEHAQRPLAAPLTAAPRARRVPVLPGAGGDRGATARTHDDRLGQRALSRRGNRPVGAVAMGRVARPDTNWRLGGWCALIVFMSTIAYASQLTSGPPPKDVAYQWSSSILGLV